MHTQQRLFLDEARLQETWNSFLRHPASQSVREELSIPFWGFVFVWILSLVIGLGMLVTIRWTLDGLRCLWSFIKLEAFQEMNDNDPTKKPDNYQPIIAHLIIVGPDRKHGLALGTFRSTREYSLERVASIAAALGSLYKQGSNDPRDAETCALLRDDSYRPYRRRKLPPPYDDGLELMLLDVEVNLAECRPMPGGSETLITCMAAKKGDGGSIVQLPWAVAESAFRWG